MAIRIKHVEGYKTSRGALLTLALLFSGANAATADDNSTDMVEMTQLEQSGIALTAAGAIKDSDSEDLVDGISGETNGVSWTLVKEDVESPEGVVGPQFSVGVGWYIYLYLTPRDWNFVTSVGWAGAGGGLCTLVGGGLIGGVSCSTVGGAIGWKLSDKTGPKGNQCAEVKVRVGYKPVGYKIFKKSCAAMGK
ncbi:hypothetical protein [Ancrocorticia populi]|uniref:Uncharacterized protein n=1 Tax=Ancrocorticia populi TaxID=2175228 RepID=A0A2V1KEB6_9ACTO|nr:hypothetical protein [Ancrocorticia populi]PWF27264.1 hypothetical protein DD236_02395 [Ancrocorticia populi]